jgi:tRNA pseudouridine(38-40) synthase
VFTTREGFELALPGRRQLGTLADLASLVVALLIALFAANRWELWLTWRYAVPFGQADPILGHDVSYYVFSLPFYRLASGLIQTLIVLAALAVGALYLMTGSMASGFPLAFGMTRHARRHLSLLAACFFATLVVTALLQRTAYLVQSSGMIAGANYSTVWGRIPAMLVLAVAALAGVGLAIHHARVSAAWPIPVAIGLYLAASAGAEAYSALLHRFVVSPNEQARETPFLQYNIDGTRRAFNLEGVEERPLSGDALLTRQEIARNAETLENVRLWDHQPLLETFGQIQEIRTYYDFVSVDNDRYRINGALRQVMLSARELNSSSLPNRTWVNERLTFTHGYGLTLGPVNQVTGEGLPVLFIRDLPPQTTADLTVTEPSLYFGELSNDYVIVRTRAREFHYPRGDDNVFNQYDGMGGVPLGSLWRKLVFALRFQSYQILLSDDISPESRILFNRNIRERVRRIAPFLALDQDPYLVLADGRLFWFVDAYTSSAMYPVFDAGERRQLHSQFGEVRDRRLSRHHDCLPRRRRRSDCRHVCADLPGHVQADRRDARLAARARALPEDLFAIQAQVYATYHMTQPAVLYNREDQWDIPTIDEGSGEARAMQPYYTIMRLPGEQSAEFIQMLPFTPRRRDNLAAWLVARSDGEHYGRLRVFEFPKQKLVFGPRQVVARIAQDQVISPQITLWNQQGSQVIWGTLMVIPIEESLIYVRPLYLRASGGRIPELTRVIVAYENRIVMEDTLNEALERLFSEQGSGRGGSTSAPPPAAETTTSSAAPRQAHRRSREAQPYRRPGISGRSPPKHARTTTGPLPRSVPATGPRTAPSSSSSGACSTRCADVERPRPAAPAARRPGRSPPLRPAAAVRTAQTANRARHPRTARRSASQAHHRVRGDALLRLADSNQRAHRAGELEMAIAEAAGTRSFELYGSGRTDAGVHALAQVAHLAIDTPLPPDTWRRRINELLPPDIVVLRVEPVSPRFHARHDAQARAYLYQVARRRTAFAKPFVWWVKDDVNVERMRAAAARLVGFHDFHAFSDDDPSEKSTDVHLERLDLVEAGDSAALPRGGLALPVEDGASPGRGPRRDRARPAERERGGGAPHHRRPQRGGGPPHGAGVGGCSWRGCITQATRGNQSVRSRSSRGCRACGAASQ